MSRVIACWILFGAAMPLPCDAQGPCQLTFTPPQIVVLLASSGVPVCDPFNPIWQCPPGYSWETMAWLDYTCPVSCGTSGQHWTQLGSLSSTPTTNWPANLGLVLATNYWCPGGTCSPQNISVAIQAANPGYENLPPGNHSATVQWTPLPGSTCNGLPQQAPPPLSVNVTIVGPPTIVVHPQLQTLYSSGTLQVIATGGLALYGYPPSNWVGTYDYEWYRDNVQIGIGSSTLYPPPAMGCSSYPVPGTYYARVGFQMLNQWAQSQSVTIPPPSPPVVLTQPMSQSVTVGQPVTLSVGTNPPSPSALFDHCYQWRMNGQDIPLATYPTFMIGAFTCQNVGAYSVVVSNSSGSVTSADALLTSDACLEFVDASDPRFFSANGGLTSDSQVLAEGGPYRIGVVADGVTKLVVRVVSADPGTVTFEIVNAFGNSEDGTLTAPYSGAAATSVVVNTVLTSLGHRAVAIYEAPLDFVRNNPDVQLRERFINLRASFVPTGGGPPLVSTRQVRIRRPPVVLCHGQWSDPSVWDGFTPLVTDSRFYVRRANYGFQNASSFFANSWVVSFWADQARNGMNSEGIACAQVDWVGHSMGGLLARVAFRTSYYRRGQNFLHGDIHKLITLNSPHWGSPVANLVASIRDLPVIGIVFAQLMADVGWRVDEGSTTDLAEGSPALAAIGPTDIASHTISGNGGSLIIGLAGTSFELASQVAPPGWSALFKILDHFEAATTTLVYRDQEHDFLVLRASGKAGLGTQQTTAMTGVATNHIAVTANAAYSNLVIDLLNATTVSSGRFASGLPAPNLNPALSSDGLPPPVAAGTLTLTSSTPGGIVMSGQMVVVTATPSGGLVPQAVTFIWPDGSWSNSMGSPHAASWTVPIEFLGPISVGAIARTPLGEIAFHSSPLHLVVATTGNLTAISVDPDVMTISTQGGRRGLYVVGSFSDAVSRKITAGATGTTYQSSNTAVVTVDNDGVVTAVTSGTATITASNSGMQATAIVHVETAPITLYGAGFAGSGGIVPSFVAVGTPAIGNSAFQIKAVDVLGGASGVLGASLGSAAIPLFSGQSFLLIDLAQTHYLGSITATGTPGLSGDGSVIVPLPLPNDPGLVGLTIYGQCGFLDVGSAHGWSLTNGLQITVVP